ncbi:MAG: hypothetical protein GYA55_12490 [SAR324 cluster bacterium]|uniref:Yip1 domain-containing protein n=1 Tax=SAR324 cluster bacterium TaxID=2024889 RepID=A0A7X9IKC6_9DELT|nr:hypothetical protein [SAR324 cluster bacterium]
MDSEIESQKDWPPWESGRADQLSMFIETTRDILLSPSISFTRMHIDKGYVKPFIYGVFGTLSGALLNFCYQYLFGTISGVPTPEMARITTDLGGVWVVFAILWLLFSVTAGIFIGAAIDHAMLFLVGAAKKPYEATFRVFAYAGGATGIVSVVPVCGSIISFFWNFVLRIIGYSKVHEISGFRASIAVLLPILLCCVCMALVFSSLLFFGVHSEPMRQFFQKGLRV